MILIEVENIRAVAHLRHTLLFHIADCAAALYYAGLVQQTSLDVI